MDTKEHPDRSTQESALNNVALVKLLVFHLHVLFKTASAKITNVFL